VVLHCRLGHLNHTYINQFMKKEMVDGMNCASCTQTQKECEAHVLGKMQKKHFLTEPTQGNQTILDCSPYEIEMHVAQCKWNQKVVVGTCLRSLIIIHDIQLLTSKVYVGWSVGWYVCK